MPDVDAGASTGAVHRQMRRGKREGAAFRMEISDYQSIRRGGPPVVVGKSPT